MEQNRKTIDQKTETQIKFLAKEYVEISDWLRANEFIASRNKVEHAESQVRTLCAALASITRQYTQAELLTMEYDHYFAGILNWCGDWSKEATE